MKLADKRFWGFEAIILICTIVSIITLRANHLLFHYVFAIAFYCLLLAGSVIAWKLYKGDQWWKLAGYMFLISTVFLAIVLLCFAADWNDTGERPATIPPDVGTYVTANELCGITVLLWLVVAPAECCVIAYISKRILKPKDSDAPAARHS